LNPATTMTALELIRQVLAHYSDAPVEQIVPEAELASLQVDSLTLAEMLFELEDRLGVTISEETEPPKLVSDMMRLIEPHMALIRAKAAA
jgi:acyl carrier protein